jgi:hypothetical protein
MTREEAQRLLQTFMSAVGQPSSEGLNPQGFGGAMLGDAQLYFEYHSDKQELETSALIYKFREAPKPGVLEGFRAEEQSGTDTGGGKVDYEPENKSLFLSRTYATVPADAAFKQDMERLTQASLVWGDEVLDRVASRVFHPEESQQR